MKQLMQSPYAPLAYRYLNQALATALGNEIFMEQLASYNDITYSNTYCTGICSGPLFGNNKI